MTSNFWSTCLYLTTMSDLYSGIKSGAFYQLSSPSGLVLKGRIVLSRLSSGSACPVNPELNSTYPPVPSRSLLSTKLKMSWNSCSRQGRESGTAETCSLQLEEEESFRVFCCLPNRTKRRQLSVQELYEWKETPYFSLFSMVPHPAPTFSNKTTWADSKNLHLLFLL